jgi:hypothetical protein
MAEILKNPLKFPVKIGQGDRVKTYSSSLINGEEQLLITRDCKFFMTVGDGTYKEFETINKGITYDKVTDLVNNLDIKLTKNITDIGIALTGDIKTLKDAITSLELEFKNYVTETEFQSLTSIVDALKVIATHDNREVLDLFSKDADNNPLFGGKKIIGDTSKLDAEIADLNNRSIIGSSLDYGLFKMTIDSSITEVQEEIPFNTVMSGKLSIVNNKVQLKAGKKYKLKGILRGQLSSNGDYLDFQFYDNTKETLLGIAGTLTNGDYLEQQIAKSYIEPDVDTEISLRSIKMSGNIELHYGFSSMEVEEVGRTVIIDPAEDAKKMQFEYGMFKLQKNQNTLGVNDLVKFNSLGTGNMSINSSTSSIPLMANKTYSISINISGEWHNTVFALYNVTTNELIQILYGDVNDTDFNYLSTANILYSTTSDCQVAIKCTAIYGAFSKINSDNTQITIQEIARPYYFNYYKDSISSTVLFDGDANELGTFNLSDSVENYESLKVIYEITNSVNTLLDSTQEIIKSQIEYGRKFQFIISLALSTYTNHIAMHFANKNSFTIDDMCLKNEDKKFSIKKIIGIGFNYDNPYRDIVTTIEDFDLSDVEADSAIVDIWTEVGK